MTGAAARDNLCICVKIFTSGLDLWRHGVLVRACMHDACVCVCVLISRHRTDVAWTLSYKYLCSQSGWPGGRTWIELEGVVTGGVLHATLLSSSKCNYAICICAHKYTYKHPQKRRVCCQTLFSCFYYEIKVRKRITRKKSFSLHNYDVKINDFFVQTNIIFMQLFYSSVLYFFFLFLFHSCVT